VSIVQNDHIRVGEKRIRIEQAAVSGYRHGFIVLPISRFLWVVVNAFSSECVEIDAVFLCCLFRDLIN